MTVRISFAFVFEFTFIFKAAYVSFSQVISRMLAKCWHYEIGYKAHFSLIDAQKAQFKS